MKSGQVPGTYRRQSFFKFQINNKLLYSTRNNLTVVINIFGVNEISSYIISSKLVFLFDKTNPERYLNFCLEN